MLTTRLYGQHLGKRKQTPRAQSYPASYRSCMAESGSDFPGLRCSSAGMNPAGLALGQDA